MCSSLNDCIYLSLVLFNTANTLYAVHSVACTGLVPSFSLCTLNSPATPSTSPSARRLDGPLVVLLAHQYGLAQDCAGYASYSRWSVRANATSTSPRSRLLVNLCSTRATRSSCASLGHLLEQHRIDVLQTPAALCHISAAAICARTHTKAFLSCGHAARSTQH
jgi:hypothetical protein